MPAPRGLIGRDAWPIRPSAAIAARTL